MKPLRLLTILCLSLVSIFALTASSASGDARTDCVGADAEATGANVAALRTAVICLTNPERVARGLKALKEQSQLTTAAQAHSDDMAKKNYFAHVDKSGGDPGDRAKKAGYTTGFVGENITAGTLTPIESMTVWMGSTGHCANILSAKYVDIGIGVATNATSEYGIYWTMVLGGNDSSTPNVTIRCPFSDLVSGTVTSKSSPSASAVKTKITSAKRLKNGKYLVQGKITPASKGTTVKLTIKRGSKKKTYTVKTSKLGSFVKTISAPAGSGKVTVSAKA